MVHAAITAERIIVSFDFFHLMAPARMDRHNYMDVVTQWLQGVHWESNITQQRVIQLHHSITKNQCCNVQRDQNITKKTLDYRELFTQLLDLSLNIYKQGCLIGKDHQKPQKSPGRDPASSEDHRPELAPRPHHHRSSPLNLRHFLLQNWLILYLA